MGNGKGSRKRNGGSHSKGSLEEIVRAEDLVNVYDTSAIIHDPNFLNKDDSKTIVIPHTVIEELDQLKIERSTPRAYSARSAIKKLRNLVETQPQDPTKGCYKLGNKEIYFMSSEKLLPEFPLESKPDNHILAVAYQAQQKFQGKQVNLITRDSGLNVKAHSVGLKSHFYDLDFIKTEQQARDFTGVYNLKGELAKKILRDYVKRTKLSPKTLFKAQREEYFRKERLYPNEILFLKEVIDVELETGAPPPQNKRTQERQQQLFLKYNSKTDELVEYQLRKEAISGIHARGLEQQIALDLLLDPEIHLVILIGEYGSGKTLLALAAGLEQVRMGGDKTVVEDIKQLERQIKGDEKCIGEKTKELADHNFNWGVIYSTKKGKKKEATPAKEEVRELYKSIGKKHEGVNEKYFKDVITALLENSKKLTPHEVAGNAILGPASVAYNTFSQLWDDLTNYCVSKYQEKIQSLSNEKDRKISNLEQLRQKKTGVYEGIPITRAFVPVGKDIGFLPGDESEKTGPWLKGIKDNLKEIARGKENPEIFVKETLEHVIDYLHTGTLRGASMHDRFFILEDVQNYTSHEIKLLISRAGRGTKIVMTGDLNQIDNPYLNRQTSGLNYLIERVSSLNESEYSHRVAIVHLPKSQRSDLTRLAQELFGEEYPSHKNP